MLLLLVAFLIVTTAPSSAAAAAAVAASPSYKPVVIVHGTNEQPTTLQFFADYIRQAHPGTNVTLIHILHGTGSFLPMWFQTVRFGIEIVRIARESPAGINLIGYSQGGLVARAVVESYPDHGVKTFVSLAGPHMGVFGQIEKRSWPFYDYIVRNLYKIFYTPYGQLSNLGGYWNDPHHHELFLNQSRFLTFWNNIVSHPFAKEYKTNFLKLDRLVLIGTRDDTTITPWQSSQFGFYDQNENIIPMEQQDVYTNDTFGLRTLHERGGVSLVTVEGLDHQDLPNDVAFLQKHLLPWLD